MYFSKEEIEAIIMLKATELGWKILYKKNNIYIKKRKKPNERFNLKGDIEKILKNSFN